MDIKCPGCGQPMEPGFLGSESYVEGAKWYSKKTALGLGGEKVKDPELMGMVYLDALRCKACKLILARY